MELGSWNSTVQNLLRTHVHLLARTQMEDLLSGSTSSGVHHSGVLEEWFGEHWWTGCAFVHIVLTVAIFVPLICFKRIDSLRFSPAISFSLAVLFLIVVIGVTIYKLIMGSIETPTLFPSVTDLASFCDIFTAVPVVAFCLCLPLQCSHN
ncbi:hypothetical protein ACB094_01G217900 [Castanea mollissima]